MKLGDMKLSDIPQETIERGRKEVERLLSMEIVSDTWEARRKSNLVKWLMSQSALSMDQLALYLGCSKQYLNNKFNRDSFSIEDFIIAAYASDYTIVLQSNDGEIRRQLDAEGFFKGNNDETWDRIRGLKQETKEDKRIEYEQKKAELERMKKEYGFED